MTGADDRLRMVRPGKPALALGLAVSHLMGKPAFAQLRFGAWSRILVGQINRGHYAFAVDPADGIRGFMGWALTSRETAEAWVAGRPLSYAESLAGECLLFNAWSADSTRVHRFMVDEARKLIRDRETVYFRRHYRDGSSRPVRLTVNDFVDGHIGRRAGLSVRASDGNRPPVQANATTLESKALHG